MFKKRTLIPAFLCMLLLATACTAKSEDGQDKTEKTSEVKDEKDGKKKKAKNKGGEEDTSLGNTYWICKEESEYEDRNIELIINEDGTFHFIGNSDTILTVNRIIGILRRIAIHGLKLRMRWSLNSPQRSLIKKKYFTLIY